MKYIGATLLVSSFCGFALLNIWDKKSRIRALRELCCALELMQGELSLRESSIPELCSFAAQHARGSAERLFRTLSDSLFQLGEDSFPHLWDRAITACCVPLRNTERDALKRLGVFLGRYETQIQLRELSSCTNCLKNGLEDAERSFPSERKLWLGLCAAAGIMTATLLL